MSAAHWLGTDNLGRDLLSRMIYGARITLFIAVLATALSFSLGAILGFSAAVFGGWFDTLMSRFVDLLMSIPTLIFGLVVLSVLPTTLVTLIMVMGILDSTRVFRLSRAVAVDINVMDFVEAAKLRGEGRGWIPAPPAPSITPRETVSRIARSRSSCARSSLDCSGGRDSYSMTFLARSAPHREGARRTRSRAPDPAPRRRGSVQAP